MNSTRKSNVTDVRGTDLSRFQIDVLSVLYGRPRHGAGLRRELEEYYDDEIPHRRVYENLDKLGAIDLVDKNEFEVSDKAHRYELTKAGEIVVYEYATELAVRLNII